MKETDGIVAIYSGDEVSVIHLKGELESADIQCLIRSDYESGLSAGFMGGTPTTYELFVLETSVEAAQPILQEFFNQPAD